MGLSYSASVWILFLDVCKTLPRTICSLIDSARQKKTELSIFTMSIYSWNYKNQTPIGILLIIIQTPISNYLFMKQNNAILFFPLINYINNLAVKWNPIIKWECPGGKIHFRSFIHSFIHSFISFFIYTHSKYIVRLN